MLLPLPSCSGWAEGSHLLTAMSLLAGYFMSWVLTQECARV